VRTKVKICGLKTPESLAAAERAGAAFAGFVFFEKSPRNISFSNANELIASTQLTTVGLFVDPTDDVLRNIPQLKMIQLHGNETPQRVAAIKSLTGLPVMKALRIATRDDLQAVALYAGVADWLLFDAKIEHAHLPGGMGRNFDWSILRDFKSTKPWMLAGGLTPENIRDALGKLTPDAVDVSSGVESAPGVKDAGKIAAFVANVRAC
jgi:phosphoribosylanthranilate isomerase